jgi:amino acid transporter
MDSAASGTSASEIGEKGLKANAISFLSNVVIGVASTAPAYSLAATLGLVTAAAGYATPAIMLVAFVPMLCIAIAYHHLNRADPDCGTTFSWVTRAMGPHAGWMGGWGIIVTDIIVMPNLAAIAGQYSFQLFGVSDPSVLAVTLVGVLWIVVMTAICYVGIELSAHTQRLLLGAEVVILAVFAVVALVRVYGGSAPASAQPVSLGWLNPFAVGSFDNFTQALLLAVFIYWGWDSGVSVNEETRNPGTAPGHAAVVSTFVLLALYVGVAVAAVAFAGPDLLSKNSNDVFAATGEGVLGPWLNKLLIIAVLTSASASTQTTILPTARTALSMARAGAIPRRFGDIHPRFMSPSFATLIMGAVSIIWYVGLTLISTNVLADSILALGLGISFYYGLTGFACVVLHRRELTRSAREFLLVGVLPAVGGLIMLALFVKSCIDLSRQGSTKIFGIGDPVVIGLGALLSGFLVMALAQRGAPDFFRRKPDGA